MCFCRQVNQLNQRNQLNRMGTKRKPLTPISNANRPQVQPAYRPAALPVPSKKLS